MKRFFKNYFWILFVSVVVFTGCSTEQEIANPDEVDNKGKITFSFPMVKETATYATVAATGDESLFTAANMTIYMVSGLGVVEKVFSGAAITTSGSGTTQSATVAVTGEITSAKTFYFVANASSVSGLSSIIVGSKLANLLKLTTVTQSAQLSSTGGLLLTGSTTVQPDDFTTLTPTPIKVVLKRRVARFDISNIAATSGITIKKIYISNARQTALIFTDKDSLPQTKGNLPVIDYSAVAGANTSLTKSVFYLYPSDDVSIQLLATGVGGAERLYNIPLPTEGIQANKSYTIKTSVTNSAAFELGIENWDGYGDAVVSSANPITIVSSSATGYPAGWDGTTLRYVVNNSTVSSTITLNISTLTSKGVDLEVTNAPAGYSITTNKGTVATTPTQTGTAPFSYNQTVTITVPAYTLGPALEAKVLIKDMYDQSQCKTVVIAREDYFPTPHKGWAGSNIYWNGSRLTFDDVGVTTHEQYQGVYFQWGSLYGISPVGSWSGSVTLYPPAGGTALASTTPISGTWANIPRIPNVAYAPATDKDYRDWAFAYQVTNSTTGIGDICKYLTDKGWAPAGKKWRMPTSNEFEAAADYTSNKVGDFAAQVSDKADGTYIMNFGYRKGSNPATDPFFPASGGRNASGGLYDVGTYGSYWSGSPYSNVTNGYYLTFNSSGVYPANNFHRANGFPVRCVVE